MNTHNILLILFCFFISSCDSHQGTTKVDSAGAAQSDTTDAINVIKTDSAIYSLNGKSSRGFIAYDENRKGKLPIVVILPEWWGVNTYTMSRAKQLAELGYFAIDADLYGGGDTASNPMEAMAFTKPYYTNPQLALAAVEAAITKAGTYSQADTSRVAAIGYCFGGFIALNAAKMGATLKAVVSFHGDLSGLQPKKDMIKADILICQGGSDPFVPEAAQQAFKKSMDSVGAHYTFISYPSALHAFTNPNSTANGIKFKIPIAYNAAADSASWKAMQELFLTALK
jgi:dienelactone hydrolase